MIYLDWASTTPLHETILRQLPRTGAEYFGNPSSIHFAGRQAEQLINTARQQIAAFAGCLPEELVFTSGATEANNMVLYGLLNRLNFQQKDTPAKKIIISGIEHPSVYDAALGLKKLGFEITVVDSEPDGIILPDKIARAIDSSTILVMVMHVNNETGAIQPVREIAALVKQHPAGGSRKILLHTDAVQSFGKIPFHFAALGVDSAALSAHKIQGPKGIGALIVRRGAGYHFLFKGGSQESGRRPGTENLLGIHGFQLAVEALQAELNARYARAAELTTFFCSRAVQAAGAILIPAARQEQPQADYSPYIIKLAFPPVPGEVLVRVLEDNGILVSTGSACGGGNQEKLLRVLTNMQVPPEIAACCIRVSIGHQTTRVEIDKILRVLTEVIPKLRKLAG